MCRISILPAPALGDNSKKALWLAEQCDSGFIVWVRRACTSAAASSVSKQLQLACLHLRFKSAKEVALSLR
jgi:hypothetical protein